VKISVALCTYNGEKHLGEQLASLSRQGRAPDELIVCDDGSSDGTVQLLRDFANEAPFPVEVHLNDRNLGSTKNFEQAIGLCHGDVVAPCDQDDSWLSTKLARIEATFRERPELGLVVSDAWLCDAALQSTGRRAWPQLPFTPTMQRRFDAGGGCDMMLRHNLVTGALTAFRADLRPLLLPIPGMWVHDGWIGFLAAAVAPAHAIADPQVLYRQHVGQQIGIAQRTLSSQIRTAWTRLTRDYYGRLADGFDALKERLDAHADRLLDPTLPDRVAAKARLARTQQRMRESGRLRRIGMAARELVTGRYHRYAQGVLSFGVDALFP
jgi:glycosyltransferase involved in cell wall biosynthesis